jgi:hypothetical protein
MSFFSQRGSVCMAHHPCPFSDGIDSMVSNKWSGKMSFSFFRSGIELMFSLNFLWLGRLARVSSYPKSTDFEVLSVNLT